MGWRLEQVGLHWCGPFVEWISDLLLTTPGLFQVTTFHYVKSFSLIWGGYLKKFFFIILFPSALSHALPTLMLLNFTR